MAGTTFALGSDYINGNQGGKSAVIPPPLTSAANGYNGQPSGNTPPSYYLEYVQFSTTFNAAQVASLSAGLAAKWSARLPALPATNPYYTGSSLNGTWNYALYNGVSGASAWPTLGTASYSGTNSAPLVVLSTTTAFGVQTLAAGLWPGATPAASFQLVLSGWINVPVSGVYTFNWWVNGAQCYLWQGAGAGAPVNSLLLSNAFFNHSYNASATSFAQASVSLTAPSLLPVTVLCNGTLSQWELFVVTPTNAMLPPSALLNALPMSPPPPPPGPPAPNPPPPPRRTRRHGRACG
jgi:hypothetical protein